MARRRKSWRITLRTDEWKEEERVFQKRRKSTRREEDWSEYEKYDQKLRRFVKRGNEWREEDNGWRTTLKTDEWKEEEQQVFQKKKRRRLIRIWKEWPKNKKIYQKRKRMTRRKQTWRMIVRTE